jgi:hypothetical protein
MSQILLTRNAELNNFKAVQSKNAEVDFLFPVLQPETSQLSTPHPPRHIFHHCYVSAHSYPSN